MKTMSGALDLQDDPDARTYMYSDSELMRRIFRYLYYYKREICIVSILTAIGIVLGLLSPFVLRKAIDIDFISGDLLTLMATAALYVILNITVWLCNAGMEYVTAKMGQAAIYDLRQELYQHLQTLSQDFYDRSSSGRIISRLTNDIDRIGELLSGGLISTFAQFFLVFAIGVVLFTVDIQLATMSLLVLPVLVAATVYFRRQMKEAYRQTRKTISIVTSNLAESISGVKVTKSFAREKTNIDRFETLIQADYKTNVDAGRAQSTFFPTVRLISAMGLVLILWVGGHRLMEGTITLGTVVLFMSFSDQFFRPILTISNFYTTVQSAFAGAERVFGVIDTEPSVKDREDAIVLPPVSGHIRFRNVTFGYIEGKNVLEDFNLEIRPGEVVALVGDTGAGKSTVVNLLLRFYDVKSGSIEIDGIDIRDVTQESLRSNIGVVLQDPFLFSDSVRNNIRYGRPDATDEEVAAAVESLGARRMFEGLHQGLDTQVGERGVKLSEGERQLVSFARALLMNPRILILDEATSSVDIYTEHTIQQSMRRLLSGRTAIVVAHRLSTIINADRILVMESGKIVEEGTHRELIKRRGKYYSLYEAQIRPRTMEIIATR